MRLTSRALQQLTVGLAVAVALYVGDPSTSEAHTANGAARCALRHSHTVLETGYARVYRRYGLAYGCLFSRGKKVTLGSYSQPDDLVSNHGQRNFAAAGRYVAFEDYTVGQSGARYLIKTVDLKTGRLRFSVPDGRLPSSVQDGESHGLGPTTDVVLRATGGTAWITKDAYASETRYEVHKRDADGSALLDQGSQVEPGSLRLQASTLAWTSAGVRRSATLR
jgi:hypothetical protein